MVFTFRGGAEGSWRLRGLERLARLPRIQIGIGDPIVDRIQSGDRAVSQVGHLDWRRLACERQQAAIGHVQGEIDQNIDAVIANCVGQRLIRQARCVNPAIAAPADPGGESIGPADAGIRDDLKSLPVVVVEQGGEEPADRMLPEIRRDVADAQPALRRAVIVVRPPKRLQRVCVPLPPGDVPGVQGGGAHIGVEKQQVEQVAVAFGELGVQVDGFPKATDRFGDPAGVLQRQPQVVHRRGVGWIELKGLAVGPDGGIGVAAPMIRHAEVAEELWIARAFGGGGAAVGDRFVQQRFIRQRRRKPSQNTFVNRLQGKRSSPGIEGGVGKPQFQQAVAEMDMSRDVIRSACDGLLEAGRGFVEPASLMQCGA